MDMTKASRLHNKYTNAGSTTPQTDKSTFHTGSPTAPLPCVKAILVSSDSSMSKVESSVFRAIPIFISSAAALFSPDTSGTTSSPIASTSLTMVSKGFLAAAGIFPSASSSLSLRDQNDIKVVFTLHLYLYLSSPGCRATPSPELLWISPGAEAANFACKLLISDTFCW